MGLAGGAVAALTHWTRRPIAPCDQFGVNSELSMTGIVVSVHVPKNAWTSWGVCLSIAWSPP